MSEKRYPYPLAVITDRYSGIFAGAKFTAWNRDPDMIPEDVFGGDGEAMDFWIKYHNKDINRAFDMVGFGNTPNEAVDDLIKKLESINDFVGLL